MYSLAIYIWICAREISSRMGSPRQGLTYAQAGSILNLLCHHDSHFCFCGLLGYMWNTRFKMDVEHVFQSLFGKAFRIYSFQVKFQRSSAKQFFLMRTSMVIL